MNAKQLQPGSEGTRRAKTSSEWWPTVVLLLGLAVVLFLAGRGSYVQSPAASPAQPVPLTGAMNNHLYVPCSVSGCGPAMTVAMNNHLYVPCSVSGCDPARTVIMNNHLYVPCSVSGCDPAKPVVMNNHLYVPCSVKPCD